MSTCQTCDLIERRDRGEAPEWDCIVRTPTWDMVHSYNTSLLGWIVLVVRRHVATLAELSDSEAMALGPLIRDVSRVLHQICDCEKTYAVQFAEHPLHRHVHVHVIPRAADLDDQHRGPGVFDLLGVAEPTRVSERDMNEFATAFRREFRRE